MLETADWTFTTLPALSACAAEVYGDRPVIEDADGVLSYRDFDAQRRTFARALIASGVMAGDRVVIWAPNSRDWLIAALGIASAGAIMIPASTRFKASEIDDLLARSGARMIVSVGHFLGVDYPAMLSAASRSQLADVVVIGSDPGTNAGWDTFLARADRVGADKLAEVEAAITPDTTVDILFTSGTTGRSKGVMYGHGQFLRAVANWTERVGLQFGDRVLVIPPFFHAFGYRGGAIGSMITGATILPHLTYDPEDVLRRVEQERIFVIPGPPAIFQGMLNHPELERFDRSSLRLGITGGAVIPSVLVERMRSDLGFAGVCNGYGLTECGGFGAMCRYDDPVEVIAKTAGKPMRDVEIAMKGPDGALLAPGETGEIVIRGYIVMQGYFRDAEATAETIDAEGWLHTGDIGRFDADGNLIIEDRLKEMYIAGGFNCYPAEIERLLSQHPAIGQVAVIGVPDDRMGEVGNAFVVLRPGTSATPEDIIAWARENMSNYKVPRRVEARDALPVSAQGKVLKRELRDELLASLG